jgi:hypothetical protein
LFPLSLTRRGGGDFREGAKPPLLLSLPFLFEGEGDKGDRVDKQS